MKLNYTFLFIIPLALIFLLDNLFMELLAPDSAHGGGTLISSMAKLIAGIAIAYSALFFQRMSIPMKWAFFLTSLYLFGLSMESAYKYGTFFVYPHVFLKVMIFFYSIFIYTYYKGNNYLKMSHLVFFILAGFWLNVMVVNPHALSISSFTNHERGVHSTSVYMLIIPFLYFLTQYFFKAKWYSLPLAFFVLLTIFFFQHRTVWVCTVIVLAVYYLLFRFKTDTPIGIGKILPIIGIIIAGGLASSAFLFSMHPEIITKILENFSDIENFDKQGTGSWRYNQWLSYLPFIQDNLVMGMRFEGFELPIQFYRDDIDKPVFEDGYGHFFHSFYVDVLFYAGLLGLSLFLWQAFYAIWKALRVKRLNEKQIIMIAFIISGFVFGISYILPAYYYGILGLTIVLLEEDEPDRTSYLREFATRRKRQLIVLRERLIPS